MFTKQFFTIGDLADELNVGESTVKYWADLYEDWIPYSDQGRDRWYPRSTIEILRFIAQRSSENADPEEIKELLTRSFSNDKEIKQIETDSMIFSNANANQNLPDMIGNLSSILLPFLEELAVNQKRIAGAQERRAIAEEKKAEALDKRATAERLKVEALNKIASALQDIGLKGGAYQDIEQSLPALGRLQQHEKDTLNDNLTEFIDSPEIELPMDPNDLGELDELTGVAEMQAQADIDDLSALLNEPSLPAEVSPEIDDLSDLVDTSPNGASAEIDDLSTLLDEPRSSASPGIDDLSTLVGDFQESVSPEVDDLSALLDEPQSASSPGVDDLSALLDTPQETASHAVDDLSALLDEPSQVSPPVVDDLSALLSEPQPSPSPEVDDLSALIDISSDVQAASPKPDDLSALIENQKEVTPQTSQVDDLSALLDPEPANAPPPQKPTVQNAQASNKPSAPKGAVSGDYKNKIIAIVIKMKEKEKLTHEEAAQKLNSMGVKPITGKGTWGNEAMLEIYNYIDIVKATREH